MSEQRGKPESAPPEEEWVEESEEQWVEEQEWEEEPATGGASKAGAGPKQTPAYMSWLAGLVGLMIGLFAFKSCNP